MAALQPLSVGAAQTLVLRRAGRVSGAEAPRALADPDGPDTPARGPRQGAGRSSHVPRAARERFAVRLQTVMPG